MTGSLRLVHVVRSDGFAGVERHIAVLARAQAAKGHSVTVIGGNRHRMPLALREAPVRFLRGETVATATRAIARLAGDVDLVHAHMTAAEFAASLASLRPGPRCPIVTTRHFAAPRGQSPLGRLTAGFIARRISAQIAISHFVADRVDGACQTVYPGVDPFRIAAAARDRAVLVVQRLEQEKRTDVAIEAFARSGLTDQGWRLRIAGEGALRDELGRQAAALGMSGEVDFLGMRADVPELMARASVMVAPCPVEGLGLGVLEAMAARLPVVASRAGGHLETLPETAQRYCFAANDADAAAAALRELADDPALRHELADEGLRRQQEHFTPAAQADGTAAVYEAVLSKGRC